MSKQSAVQKLAAQLTSLAKAATPGPWVTDGDYVNEHGNVIQSYIANGRKAGGRIASAFANCLVKTDEQCQANAAFIAGANPKAVLMLTAEIERLEYESNQQAAMLFAQGIKLLEIDQIKAECEGLRSALTECSGSLHSEMLQKFGGQLPDDMHPVTRREYDRDMVEVAGYGAVLSKGAHHADEA
jgi:hypothetical protein